MSDKDVVQRAIEQAKAGRREQARQILRQVLQQDTDNLNAWVAMAQLSRSRVEAVYCLQQVLRLRPGNPWATTHIRRLSVVKEQDASTDEAVVEEEPGLRFEEEEQLEADLFAEPETFKASDGFPFEPPPGLADAEGPTDSFLDPFSGITSDDEGMGKSQTPWRRWLLVLLIISLIFVIGVAVILWTMGLIPH
jgi:hypothetical protein